MNMETLYMHVLFHFLVHLHLHLFPALTPKIPIAIISYQLPIYLLYSSLTGFFVVSETLDRYTPVQPGAPRYHSLHCSTPSPDLDSIPSPPSGFCLNVI